MAGTGTEMPRTRITYQRQSDPASQAQRQTANFQQQRQAQASAYAAARFNEWAAGAQDREALLNARLQNQQSEAELKGAQFRYNFWKDNELRKQTTAYYTAMPALQEQLKQNGIFPGSPRYAAEMSAFAAEIPDAVTHNDSIRKELMDFSKVDATAAQITDKAKTLQEGLAAAGQHPTSFTTTASGGMDVKSSRPNEDLQKELKDAHGITRTQFETFNPNSAYLGTLDEKGNLTKSPSGNDIQFSIVKDGKASNVSMSVPEFNRYKVAFGQAPVTPQVAQEATTPNQTPVPSATPDQATNQPAPTHLGTYNPATGEFE